MGSFQPFQKKYNLLTLMLHCHILNCNKLPSVLFSVSVVHDPAIKEESFLKDINTKQMDTHFHFLIHAALSRFSSHLCLLFPPYSFSLLFWSLFSSLFTPWYPQLQSQKTDPTLPTHTGIPPKNGRKGTQETTFMLLPLVTPRNKAFICGKHMYTFHKEYMHKSCIFRPK